MRESSGPGNHATARRVLSLTASGMSLRIGAATAAILLARVFGPADYGVYATALATGQLLMVIPDFGTHVTLLRDGARHPERLPVMLGSALGIKTAGCLLAIAALILVAIWFDYSPSLRWAFIITGSGAILLHFHETVFAAARAANATILAAGSQFGVGLAALGAALLVLALRPSLIPALALIAALPVLAACIALWRLRLYIPFAWSAAGARKLLRISAPFAVGVIIYYVYLRVDVLMLAKMASPAEVGLYNAPYRIVAVLYFLPGVVCAALFADLSRFGARDHHRHQRYIVGMTAVMGVVALALVAVLVAGAEEIIALVFGRSFGPSSELLRILAWFLLFQCVSYPLADGLTTSDRHATRLWIMASAACLNIAGNAVAIPRFGALGAANVTLLTEATLALALIGLTMIKATKEMRRSIVGSTLSLAFGAGAMLWLLEALRSIDVGIALRIAGGLAAGPLLATLLMLVAKLTVRSRDAQLAIHASDPGTAGLSGMS